MIADFIVVSPFVAAALAEKNWVVVLCTVGAAWILELFSVLSFGVTSSLLVVAVLAVRLLRALFTTSSFLTVVLAFGGGLVLHAVLVTAAWTYHIQEIRGAPLVRGVLFFERELISGIFLGSVILGMHMVVRWGKYAISKKTLFSY